MLGAESGDAILDVLGDLGADLEPEDQFGGQEGREGDEETAEAAADVGDGDGLRQALLLRRLGLASVGGVFWYDEGWVVGGPVHVGWAGGARKVPSG